MSEHGVLYEQLDLIRMQARARWIAVAWQDQDGHWQRHLRGPENPLPQAQQHFFSLLDSVLGADGTLREERWQELLRAWRADHGFYSVFTLTGGVTAFYALLDGAAVSAGNDLRGWIDLTLQAVIGTAERFERHRAGTSRQQTALESAVSLIAATSEEEVIPRGLGLALRLVTGEGAAFMTFDRERRQFVPTYIRADGKLHDLLQATAFSEDGICGEAMRTLTPQRYPGSSTVDRQSLDRRSAVAVPLHARDGFLGVLYTVAPDDCRFDDFDMSTLAFFARQLAGVIDNLRLLRKLRLTNRELSDTQLQLVESAGLDTLSEMAAEVAHDFNNILGALLGRVQLLQTRISDEGALTGLAKMERLIGDGETTVRRLQEAARSRKSQAPGPTTLNVLAREAFSAAEFAIQRQAQIEDRQLIWETDFQPAGELADPSGAIGESLRRFLCELADRAPVGSKITIRTDHDHTSDFLRFILAAPATTRVAPWSWELLEEMAALERAVASPGGRIELTTLAENEFQFTLRLACAIQESEPIAAAVSGTFRVLVVDDDAEVRDVLEELLRLDGHQVTSAENGTRALELFAPDKYDVVFTDLGMPGISGWQVAASIKRDAPEMPVVMVTGWGAQLDADKVKSSGIDRVLTKPFQWVAVRETLTELAGSRK